MEPAEAELIIMRGGQEKVHVPEEVASMILIVRDTGAVNMMDRPGVISMARQIDPDVADYMKDHLPKALYAKIIFTGLVVKQDNGQFLDPLTREIYDKEVRLED